LKGIPTTDGRTADRGKVPGGGRHRTAADPVFVRALLRDGPWISGLILVCAALLGAAFPLELSAQGGVRPPLAVGVMGTGLTPRVELGPVLDDPSIRRSLEAGLPIRVEVTSELWRVRAVDALEGRNVWRATARLDPLSGQIRVESAEGLLGSSLPAEVYPPMRPGRAGDHYYLVRMVVQTLSASDLEELRRWLRGDLSPAVEAAEDVGGAITRGLRRLFVRALGLPTQRHEARSPIFSVP
jgi:hypothetical protein